MTTPSPDDDETTTLILTRPRPASEPSPRPGGRSGLWKSAEVGADFEGSRSWVYRKANAGPLPVIRISGGSLPRFNTDMVSGLARGEETLLTRAIRKRTCADLERSNLVAGFGDEDGKLWWQRCRSGG
jgi:hypothetical protein